MSVVGIGVLEVLQGVLVTLQALIHVGFAEKADLFIGDVSEGVMELSDATECQPYRPRARLRMRTDLPSTHFRHLNMSDFTVFQSRREARLRMMQVDRVPLILHVRCAEVELVTETAN